MPVTIEGQEGVSEELRGKREKRRTRSEQMQQQLKDRDRSESSWKTAHRVIEEFE